MRLDELLQKSKPWVSILKKLQDNARFNIWFKNSKIVDKKGLPLIVYHSGYGDWRLPNPFTHFGTHIAARKKYNDDRDFRGIDGFTFPFILSIQEPKVIPDLGSHYFYDYTKLLWDIFPSIDLKQMITRVNSSEMAEPQKLQIIRKFFEKNGIDGLQYINQHEHRGSTSFITFRPAQAMPLFKLAKLVL